MGACLSFAHSVYMTSNEHPELQPIFTRSNYCVNNCEKNIQEKLCQVCSPQLYTVGIDGAFAIQTMPQICSPHRESFQ